MFLFFFTFFLCVCVFVFRVLCASRSPGDTEKSTHREDELYIESAPLAEILQNVPKLCRILKKSTQIGEFSTQLSQNLHNFKKTFRLYPATPH